MLNSPVLGPRELCFKPILCLNSFKTLTHLQYKNSVSPKRSCFCVNVNINKDFRVIKVVDDDDDGEEEESKSQIESNLNWEEEFIGVIDVLPNKKKQKEKSELLQETESTDWCVRARKSALRSIQNRGLIGSMENLVKKKKKKKKKKVNRKKSDLDLDFDSDSDVGDVEEEEEELTIENLLGDENDYDDRRKQQLKANVSMMFMEKKEKTMETFVERLSQYSSSGGVSDRKKEINLNKEIVEAQTAEQVLESITEMIMAVGKGLSPSPLSPLNLATSIHRIAKNMEKASMIRSQRLAFARRREMCMLVGMVMMELPECSAQGVSNIAWALSKIGGDLLYLSEMDRLAEVALTKVDQFNSQNVANIAGAFASMQHSSPDLFSELSKRGSDIMHTFQQQEVAQLLWAFASLNEPADSLFASLDKVEFDFSRDQIGNISWSCVVLGQMDRPFFSRIWETLIRDYCCERISEEFREDIAFATQVQLVNQCLKVECPHLNLCLESNVEAKIIRVGKTKRFNEKITSLFQKEVLRLLVSTGVDWKREVIVDGYSLDAALLDLKVALEIDGPTHFSRNSGKPLGHTVLKRRYLEAAGWKLVSVSHQKWEELEGSHEQLDYLREIIKDYTIVK